MHRKVRWIVASLVLFAQVSGAAISKPYQVYSCDAQGLALAAPLADGAKFEIHEFLVPLGPMLPAFRHEYELFVWQDRSGEPTQRFRLGFSEFVEGEMLLYYSLDEQGRTSPYWVEHWLMEDIFRIRIPSSDHAIDCLAATPD
ncbi:MAG: hypothetical protein ACK5Y2_05895 [Bdellovibrionales bacterium]